METLKLWGQLFLSCLAAVVSGFVLMVMLQRKSYYSQKHVLCLMNLVTANGLCGLIATILHARQLYLLRTTSELHVLWLMSAAIIPAMIAACVLELLSLFLLSLDRIIAIKFPFFYSGRMKSKYILVGVAMIYAVSLITSIASYYLMRQKQVEEFVYFLTLCLVPSGFLILITSNVILYIATRRQIKEISRNSVDKCKDLIKRKQEIRNATLCFGVISCFVVLWTPTLLEGVFRIRKMYHVLPIASTVSTFGIRIHLLVQIIIFVLTSKQFRKEVTKTCGKLKKSTAVNSVGSL